MRNHFSLISAGTESSTVKAARKTLLGKARERPHQARQVLQVLRAQGPVQTYRAVMKKLDAYSPLGYSSAGEVIGVGARVRGLRVGDRVACAGNTANHAAIASVPENLVVKLAAEADLSQAAYSALGAIAMQGIRRAELTLGESCAVIGLGLIGQLTGRLLRTAGVQVLGIDVNSWAVETAKESSCDHGWVRNTATLSEEIRRVTSGMGVDAVIIAAGTSSLDPINFAGEICRKRGRVVVVGAVPTGFDRDPHYYRKELDLRMSCSYGPGRYDPVYEDMGVDYPPAFVRWTEKRNMEAFQRLLESGRINVSGITTHVFPFESAADAYDLILDRKEPFLGVLLEYEHEEAEDRNRTRIEVWPTKPKSQVGVSFIGAGSYAQGFLLPNLPKEQKVVRRGVVTHSGATSRRIAEKFDFAFCASDPGEVLDDPGTDTVFIATRHDTHARFVIDALLAGKHVYVEKPLCLTHAELAEIDEVFRQRGGAQRLMVGFNRRFAPLVTQVKAELGEGPLAIVYRVNAGVIPGESWIQDPDLGGGRLIGEACHFIDLITHLVGCLPVQVYASAMSDPDGLQDTFSIFLEFANGSIGTVHYFAAGSRQMPKERVEVFQNGRSCVLDDFRRATLYRGNGRSSSRRNITQNKGQSEMMTSLVTRLRDGGEPLIPYDEIRSATVASLACEESIRNRAPVRIL